MRKLKKSFVISVFSLLVCSLVFSEQVYEITESQLLEIELNNQMILEALTKAENKLEMSENKLETFENNLEAVEKQLQEQMRLLQKSEDEKKMLTKYVIPISVILSFAGGVYLGIKL